MGSSPTLATNGLHLEPRVFTVYVLRSASNSRRYVGFTGRSVMERLSEHNRGLANGWTSRNGPFTLVYTEEYHSEPEARQREKFLKSGQGREWLNRRLAGYPPEAEGAS
ncbi:MAG: GIY-YIG nuclease family protein [Chloroflexota bacterium]